MAQKVLVYGVHHLAGRKAVSTPRDTHLKRIFRELILAREAGVKEVGTELLLQIEPTLKTRVDQTNKYFRRVHKFANSQGIKLVSLQQLFQSQVFALLHRILNTISVSRVNNMAEFNRSLEKMGRIESQNPCWPEAHALARQIASKVPITAYHLNRVRLALSFFRSLKMLEQAQAQNLSHVIMGGVHALDLQHYRPDEVEVKYLYPKGVALQKNLQQLPKKLDAFNEHRAFLEEMWAAMEKKSGVWKTNSN